MQLAWSRIWIRVAVTISYDDNHNTIDDTKPHIWSNQNGYSIILQRENIL